VRANIQTKGAVIHVIDELLVAPPAAERTAKPKPVTAKEAGPDAASKLGSAELASVAPKSTAAAPAPAASAAGLRAAALTAVAVVAAPLALVLAL